MRLLGGLDLPPRPFHRARAAPPLRVVHQSNWRGYCTISESRADLVLISLNCREDV